MLKRVNADELATNIINYVFNNSGRNVAAPRCQDQGDFTVDEKSHQVFLTEEGAIAIKLMSVRAGALPLPIMRLADELATVVTP